MLLICLFAVVWWSSIAYGQEEVLLDFPLGSLKGKTRTTINGVKIYSFQGIPYAEPPVGQYRFQATKEKEPWEGVLDATIERSICLQMTYDHVEGSEDCLFINIFTPQNPTSNASLPVMAFIHGGGFIEGSSVDVNYGPDHLMNYGVIYVTFSYRLGPFGFFSTGDDVIPGNAGLKDQVLALKFLNKYIGYFGGDPNKITIFGQSAGAASVHYHVLSPLSKGLFRAAICESGSALSAWANQKNQTEISYNLAKIINPNFANYKASSSEVYEYLKNLPAETIDRAAHQIYLLENPSDMQIQNGVYFGPVIENEHEGAFVTKPMYELLKNGEINDVTLLLGVSTEEMLSTVSDLEGLKNTTITFQNNLELLVPKKLNAEISDIPVIAQKIKDFYSPYLDFTVDTRQLIKYLSDQCFARSIIKSAELEAEWHDVYLYEFAYHGVLGGFTDTSVNGFSDDVRHGEEISYLLRRNYEGLNTTDLTKYPARDQTVQKRFITLFTNFAKYLNPTPKQDDLLQNLIWPKVHPNNLHYLAIGAWMEIRSNPKENMYKFWNDIFSQYGHEPYGNVFQIKMFGSTSMLLVVFLLLGVVCDTYGDDHKPIIVKTNNGDVKGFYGEKSHANGSRTLYWFRSIPFAEPPVGELRFEPPVPKKNWNGVLDVTENGSPCLQGANPVVGDENCLFVKISTGRKPDINNKLPVLVWIYGGAFYSGSVDFDDHSPDYLVDEDILIVGVHYRVGIWGFISTGDLVSPGNNGIRDQILALKWIKENIQYFGGDPNRITIWGQSAGAASVAYLLQTEQTQGLFHGAILNSGSSLSAWALSKQVPAAVTNVAKKFKVSTASSTTIVEGLKQIDAAQLQTAAASVMQRLLVLSNPLQGLVFTPVIEPDHPNAVITGQSHQLLKEGKFHNVPILTGYNSLEGYVDDLPTIFRLWISKYDLNNALLVPDDMNSKTTGRLYLGSKIKMNYFSLFPISITSTRLMRFVADSQMEKPILEAINLYSAHTNVYAYHFSYEGPLYGRTNRTVHGVGHTEELGYLFDLGHSGSEADYLTRDRLVRLWTNFCKYGNPTPQQDSLLNNVIWPSNRGISSMDDLEYLEIDKTLSVTRLPNKNNMVFWKNIYETYGNPPYSTY
ncbi:uncharacterized protein LOC130448317 [Diorhabda sublineata]|uniref:uncharacterized protein LOC130448317 n=1 Tax=Diorhabda sublineata TaxID=1163346 RepID=UPI0024E06F4C|nr:uncharacterized protein LOC130448317 [Diorhabda sublineata]